ncbi:MAG TPA: FGGY family carbohydrate kinase [Candidatus Acidoferrales bacterium]|nr:FGGY family carbohydrate kinase [Candidatus Acidoferrales bacterium]
MAAFVALDAGTGGGKAVVFDDGGNVLGAHREAWGYEVRVNPDMPFIKEFSFNAAAFWDILCRCVRGALERAGIAAADVVGVAATSQREGCVFLDAQGREIYAGPNLDGRGFAEGLEVLNRLGGERLYQITGHNAPFIFPIARYLWFRSHGTPAVAHLLMISDWLTYRLSGELAAEPSNATESMFFDLKGRCWSDEILSTFDIPRGILPPVLRSGERVGAVTAAAAAATGLAAGTPVFVGGADTQCSLLGAGVIDADATGATLGTTTPVQAVVDTAVFDPHGNLWAGCHVLPGRWVVESNAGDTGGAYLWLLDLIGGDRPRHELYALGERLAAAAFGPPTMMFIGPTVFNLVKMRPNRPGGLLFPFPAMHVRPERSTFVRAFLESIGYALRANLGQIAAVTGRPAPALTLSGGMTRSAALTRVIADVVGLPTRVACEPESAALGCAILIAAHASGGDLAATTRTMVRHGEVESDAEQRDRYEAPYGRWCELYHMLEETDL